MKKIKNLMKKIKNLNITNVDITIVMITYVMPCILCVFLLIISLGGNRIAEFFKEQYIETAKMIYLILYGTIWRLRRHILLLPIIYANVLWFLLVLDKDDKRFERRVARKLVVPGAIVLTLICISVSVPLPFDGYKTPEYDKMNMGRFTVAVIKDKLTNETVTIELDKDELKYIHNEIIENRRGIKHHVENVKYLVLEKEGYQIPIFDSPYEPVIKGYTSQRITIHKHTGLIISSEELPEE